MKKMDGLKIAGLAAGFLGMLCSAVSSMISEKQTDRKLEKLVDEKLKLKDHN